IYLCDDNKRKEMKELADKLGVGYFDREDNKGAKAGNLNNALRQTDSPYVVTFDADMIPQKEFLMKTVPYFVDCEIKNEKLEEEDKVKLAILQTPQSFYNTDLFQFFFYSEKRIPNEQDYFYKDIQVSRTKSNSVIYGGSNTVLSREALLDVGEIDVLKVAHHGSKSSTSESFLNRTKPKDAIISSGKNNRYGHPTQEILARLRLYDVRVLRTDEIGNIIYTCFLEKDICEVAREI
ncbi:MAG: glycosyltransferase, partial [Candidatus Moranbacteria bacterium]|nr:glycosyltransferase [Candidatus Moranbacteria bacterium]